MFKKILKHAKLVAVLLALAVGLSYLVYATTQHSNVTMTRVTNGNGLAYVQGTYTFVNAADSAWFYPHQSTIAMHDVNVGQLWVETQRPANAGAATSIGVRLETSTDGKSYQSTTIGTDSTTWATVAADSAGNITANGAGSGATDWKVNNVPLPGATAGYGGVAPYLRVLIFGKTTNAAGTKVRVTFVEQ